jgi:molybdopterin molybdotransferase
MIPVAEALRQILALVGPLDTEEVPLRAAGGRMLAHAVTARRSQPPFATSVMDGYAVAEAAPGGRLRVIGTSLAGRRWDGMVGGGEAVRIFTGAPVPDGATRIVMQEDVTVHGDAIVVAANADPGPFIRTAGADFAEGRRVEQRRLRPADLALLAAMNIPTVTVTRRPVAALIATGDELVMPGETPDRDQIIASNAFGLAALLEDAGAELRFLPIARDNEASLGHVLDLARDADLIVTIGGASVGDRDIVAAVAKGRGMEQRFHKVAMRPGKPLMAGRLGDAAMLGLPGNPVSAMVCGMVFAVPMVRAMLGHPPGPVPRTRGVLATPVDRNGPREHYMRARMTPRGLEVADRQDSALLTVLADADALVVRPPHDPARPAGDTIEFIPLR